ncbi:pentatricopeptide repeat-containing protein At4g38010-like [Musa acuminata AAA Group]|uniref:pentatricopeptide repeat-containing protein At4g38010-like n=1 Tax=Musa acuminata AAA Group TaxID=214697 RepID=UPI0031CEE1DE
MAKLIIRAFPFTKHSFSHYCQQPGSAAPRSSKILEGRTYKWNVTLRGLLEGNVPAKAILAYALMRRRGVKVDSFTLLFVVKACCLIIHDVVVGKQVHAQVAKLGFQAEVVTQTALLKMYGMFGDLDAAEKVFDETPQRDLVQWHALLAAYSQRNRPCGTMKTAQRMVNESVMPNEVGFVSIISACSQRKALPEGKRWHGYAIKNLAVLDTFVHNVLIDMYAACGCLSDAYNVFKNLRNKNTVSWTSMINAYGDNDHPNEALDLFEEMEAVGERPDEVMMLAVVSICTKLGRSDIGEWIHEYVERCGFGESVRVANALIDMHSKCGNMEKACSTFDRMTRRTLVTWTAMIQGLAMHGHGRAALTRFSQMQREGFRLDEVVVLIMINACSHAGLVEEGKHFFRSMAEEHGMEPWMEHYGSMVDLLCRAGLVNEALDFVMNMPLKPDAVIWRTLVAACRNQGNMNLAAEVLDCMMEMEPEDSGNYVLKSNLHAMIGDWDSVQEVRSSMSCKKVAKTQPAHSYVQPTHHVHVEEVMQNIDEDERRSS